MAIWLGPNDWTVIAMSPTPTSSGPSQIAAPRYTRLAMTWFFRVKDELYILFWTAYLYLGDDFVEVKQGVADQGPCSCLCWFHGRG